MDDLELAANSIGLACLIRRQLWLWVAPEQARVELQDKLDKRHGRDPEHAEEARFAIPAIRAFYLTGSLVWLLFLLPSL